MPRYDVRIKFRHIADEGSAWSAATRDCKIFRKWETEEDFDAFDGAYEIAMNNGLNHVTESEFIETALALGYRREI